jgi:hypothetical protein
MGYLRRQIHHPRSSSPRVRPRPFMRRTIRPNYPGPSKSPSERDVKPTAMAALPAMRSYENETENEVETNLHDRGSLALAGGRAG